MSPPHQRSPGGASDTPPPRPGEDSGGPGDPPPRSPCSPPSPGPLVRPLTPGWQELGCPLGPLSTLPYPLLYEPTPTPTLPRR